MNAKFVRDSEMTVFLEGVLKHVKGCEKFD
jgi:hypothetical protein